MGRSVSTPSDAVEVLYLDWTNGLTTLDENDNEVEPDDDDYDFWQNEWEYVKYDFVEHVLKHLFPSVTDVDRWLGNEDLAVAENGLAYFGVSEYAGLAALWVVPKSATRDWDSYYRGYDQSGLEQRWIAQVWPKIEAMYPHRLTLMGRFSNGEAVYQRAEKGKE